MIFEKTRHVADRLLSTYPAAIVGGTGWAVDSSLEAVGITTKVQDYSLYPKWGQSIGFTQRGCRLKCGFCVVPRKEGRPRSVNTINDIWRGGATPKAVVLLDNDFFGQQKEEWRARHDEI